MNDLKLSKNWIYYLIGAFIAYRVGGPIAAIISFLLIRQILIRWQEQSPNKENGVGFELALLKLSSMLIKSDGVVDDSEVSFVQEFFKKTFGAQKSKMLFKQLKEVKLPTDISLLVSLIRNEIRDDGYFAILQFLFALASIDGSISNDEDDFINTVGLNFNFRTEQINQIRNQFIKQESSSNKYSPEVIEHLGVLGLKEGVDMDAIKKAYKTLAKEFHPDKLSGMSEGMQNLGKEKFQQILNSYNYLKAHYI